MFPTRICFSSFLTKGGDGSKRKKDFEGNQLKSLPTPFFSPNYIFIIEVLKNVAFEWEAIVTDSDDNWDPGSNPSSKELYLTS